MKIGPAVRPVRVPEKRTGQSKESQSGTISPIWGEAPTVPIRTKICLVGSLSDIITCVKFQVETFRGYDFTGGRISHFLIHFCMGLTTVQLPVILDSLLCVCVCMCLFIFCLIYVAA